MALFAEVGAKLGLDTSSFEKALLRSRGLFGSFVAAMKKSGGGSIVGLFGVGALVRGFQETLQRAQDARGEAEKLGRTVDAGTASVARYADQWDRIKRSIGDAAVVGLSFFTRASEATGDWLNDNVASRFRGMSPAEAKRVRLISERAGANADKLSTPEAMAAAKARGDTRVAKDNAKMAEVSGLMADASERRQAAELAALPLEKQITELGRRRTEQQKTFANASLDALTRAKAFNEIAKLDTQLQEKRKTLQDELTKKAEKEADERRKSAEQAAAVAKQLKTAAGKVNEATNDLKNAYNDMMAFTIDDAADGKRGNSKDRARARSIKQAQSMAKKLYDSGNKVTLFDAATQKNVMVGPEYYQDKAISLAAGGRFVSSDKNLLGAQTEKLQQAVDTLNEIRDSLKARNVKQ